MFSKVKSGLDPFIELISSISDTEHELLFHDPGVYTLYYSVYDASDVLIEEQEYMVNVMDADALDGLLKARWNGMKSDMVNSGVGPAVNYFTISSKDNYTRMFNEIMSLENWQSLFTGMNSIEMIYARNGRAKYRITRNQVIDGIPETITYYIYFSIDEDGLWKIDQF